MDKELHSSYAYTDSYDLLCMKNRYTITIAEACKVLTEKLKPFCFLPSELQKANEVFDLSSVSGFDNADMSIRQEIEQVQRNRLTTQGVFLPVSDEVTNILYYNYLLETSVVYIEEPIEKPVDGGVEQSYNKFLATRNTTLIASWVGITKEEAVDKYAKKLDAIQDSILTGLVPYVKLNVSAKNGLTLTNSRSKLDLKKVVCTPAYAISTQVGVLRDLLKTKIIKFEYLKDNHVKRELISSTSLDVLQELYKADYFVQSTLDDVSIDRESSFTFLTRGNVKIPELGCSCYESKGTRTLNLARILSMQEVSIDDVDTEFIEVDLSNVLDGLYKGLTTLQLLNPSELPSLVNALTGGVIPVEGKNSAMLVSDAFLWAKEYVNALSTEFRRKLHKFMISHKEWFPDYTGKRSIVMKTVGNYGVF